MQIKIVADTCIIYNDAVLLVKASYRDFWQFPGGHAEVGETPHQTATRETMEEVGGGITVTRLLVLNTELNEHGKADTLCFLFAGLYDGKTPIKLQETELTEFAWVPVDQAAARLHPLVAPLFAHALKGLKENSTIYLEGAHTI